MPITEKLNPTSTTNLTRRSNGTQNSMHPLTWRYVLKEK